MKKFISVLIFVFSLPINVFAVTKDQCDLLDALLRLKGSFYTQYQGKRISMLDRDVISSYLSEYYSANILRNREILSNNLSNDVIHCSEEGLSLKSITSHPSMIEHFNEFSMHIAGYVDAEIKRKEYKDMQKNKLQAEENLYRYVMFCSKKLFDPGLTDEEINQLSGMKNANHLVSDKVLRAANAIIEISGLINTYNKLVTRISEVESHNIQHNEDNYIRNNQSIINRYKNDYMIKCMAIQIDEKLFPSLAENFNAFSEKFEQELNRYSSTLEKKQVALQQAKEEEQQRKNLIAEQKIAQEQEERQQRIKAKCTKLISSFGLSNEEYDYVIPGGGRFVGAISLGEFLCISKGGGGLTAFSKPGWFSNSYDFEYEGDNGNTQLEFVKDTYENKPILRLSKISLDGESKNLKSIIEHWTVMDPLIWGMIIQAQVHSPELFQ